jgi:hypothetical protein
MLDIEIAGEIPVMYSLNKLVNLIICLFLETQKFYDLVKNKR